MSRAWESERSALIIAWACVLKSRRILIFVLIHIGYAHSHKSKIRERSIILIFFLYEVTSILLLSALVKEFIRSFITSAEWIFREVLWDEFSRGCFLVILKAIHEFA